MKMYADVVVRYTIEFDDDGSSDPVDAAFEEAESKLSTIKDLCSMEVSNIRTEA